MEKLSPERISEIENNEQKFLEQNIDFLKTTATELGFEIKKTEIKDEAGGRSIHDDFLSKEQRSKLYFNNFLSENIFYLTGVRKKDESEVKVIVIVRPNERDCFSVDIFSSAFSSGWGGNHDFSQSELKKNLEFAINE